MTSGGSVEIISADDFIQKVIKNKIDKLIDIITEIEVLGGVPQDFGEDKHYVHHVDDDIFFKDCGGSGICEAAMVKTSEIELPVVDIKGDINDQLKDLLKGITQHSKESFKKPTSDHGLIEIIEHIVVLSLMNLGSPTHVVEFKDGTYIALNPEDIIFEVAIKDGIIKAGFVPIKRTIMGVTVTN